MIRPAAPSERPEVTRAERVLAAILGLLTLGLAAAIAWSMRTDGSVTVWALVVVLAGLGVQSGLSAWRGRRSWLLRIGPLP